jgi:hypothetical protein
MTARGRSRLAGPLSLVLALAVWTSGCVAFPSACTDSPACRHLDLLALCESSETCTVSPALHHSYDAPTFEPGAVSWQTEGVGQIDLRGVQARSTTQRLPLFQIDVLDCKVAPPECTAPICDDAVPPCLAVRIDGAPASCVTEEREGTTHVRCDLPERFDTITLDLQAPKVFLSVYFTEPVCTGSECVPQL